MTSREIVHRTLRFTHPERVGRSFHDSDFVSARHTAPSKAMPWAEYEPGKWESTDVWGNTWGRIDATSKGEVVRGVLEDFADLETYEFPDWSNPDDYDSVREKRVEYPDRWLTGGLPGFAFNIARKMRRLEQYLADLLLERDRIRQLHDGIDDLLETTIRNYADAGVDAVMFPEDWGTQNGTLIGPDLWREEFFPRFERLCATAHALNVKVFMHSCGRIEAIVPGLIEAGIDLLQFDQPDLHGIDQLARYQETNRITFWCPVDIQVTLQTRDAGVIESKVDEMLAKLWKDDGGFVAGYYGDNASIGLDSEWQEVACRRFISEGVAGRLEVTT